MATTELRMRCSVCNAEIVVLTTIVEGLEAKPERVESVVQPEDRRPNTSESGVQPADNSQTLEKVKAYMEKDIAWWEEHAPLCIASVDQAQYQIIRDYRHVLRIIGGEAG